MGQIGRFGRSCVWLAGLLAGPTLHAHATEATLIADAHVSTARPTVNSGSLSNVNVGAGYTGLMQFDLSLLPAGTSAAQVSRAVLRLYVNRVDAAGMVSLQAVNAAWVESTVTSATMPALGAATQAFSVSQAGAYVAVDLTAMVQGWITSPGSNHGLALTAAAASVQFDSKENDQTAHAAVLDLSIVSQGPAAPAGVPGLTGATGPAGPAGPAGAPGVSAGLGLNYQGAYVASASYSKNDVVIYQGSSYVSLGAQNRGNTPSATPLQWGLLAQGAGTGTVSGATSSLYQGAYSSTQNYGVNDLVTYGGGTYISLQAGNHGNPPGTTSLFWGVLGQGSSGAAGPQGAPGLVYQGTYSSVVNYAQGDVVTFQGSSYVSLTASNAGNTPGFSAAQWGLLAAGYAGVATTPVGNPTVAVSYQGVYASTRNYTLNDIVLYGASSYISLIAENHGNTPDQSAGQWGLLAEGGTGIGPAGPPGATGAPGPQGAPGLAYAGVYSSTTNYGMSDVVGYQGSSYISLTAQNHGSTPDQSPARWGLLALGGTGPAGPQGDPGLTYQGGYQSGVNYKLGDVVLWQGTTYTSLIQQNHGNTPDASPGQWGVLSARGAAGAAGARGDVGPQGLQGLPGSVGPPGERGPQGGQGIAGQAGAQGLTGAPGAQGLQGPAGPQGIAGPVGLAFRGGYLSTANYGLADGVMYRGSGYVSLIASNAGNTPDQSPAAWSLFAAAGQTGAAGATGPAGATGATGPQGAAGAPGAQGGQGAVGPQGPAVVNYTGNYASATNYGTRDAVSYGGSTYVSLGDGNHGNTPGLTSAWAVLVAQGATGAVGPTGATGAAGANGAAGPAGAQGAAGPPMTFAGGWLAGTTYPVGAGIQYGGSGYVALAGNSGRQPDVSPQYWGLLAAAGAAGTPGAAGAAGAAGAPGATGVVFRGVWSAVTSYQARDAVLFGGTSYFATAATTGLEPDQYPAAWSILAAGSTGPAGPSGVAATVAVGNVTTAAAGTQASVTNSGTSTNAVLNFVIPQGVAGASGGGGGGSGGAQALSGIPFVSTYHAVSYNAGYYSVNSSGAAYAESPAVLTWVPGACTANRIVVFSQQENPITVSLRLGATPGAMADAGLACTVRQGGSCTGTGSVAVGAGSFVDLGVSGSSGNAAGVWTAVECD